VYIDIKLVCVLSPNVGITIEEEKINVFC
jgi:hypothetical protein